MNGRLLVMAAVSLLAAVALVLVPYGRDLSATGRNGVEVDVDISVACPAPVVGAFQSGDGAGWFNVSSDNQIGGGGLCRSSAFWRLGAAVVLFFLGRFFLRRGLIRDDGDEPDPLPET